MKKLNLIDNSGINRNVLKFNFIFALCFPFALFAQPTASNPAPVSVECSADVPAPDVNVVTDEDDVMNTPVVTWEADVSNGQSCPETITRTYRVTGDGAQYIFVHQTITVQDVTAPTATNPNPIYLTSGSSAPAPNILVVTDEADNCTMDPIVTFVSDVSDGNSEPETITRTYCIQDSCGNITCVSQLIIIGSVGLDEFSGSNGITAYPNPTQGIIRLNFDEYKQFINVRTLDLNGKQISEKSFDNIQDIELSIEGEKGIYIIAVSDGNSVEKYLKVTKQ